METALRGVGYKVFRNEEIAEGMHQIIVEAPIVAERAKAGQFLILKVDEKGGELSKRGYKVFMFEALHKLEERVVVVVGGGNVALDCARVALRMELSFPDASGRPRPVPVKGEDFKLECDTVIVAIGQGPNPTVFEDSFPERNERGYIIVDQQQRTNIPNV